MDITCLRRVVSKILANSFLSFESNSTTASNILNKLSLSPESITRFRSSKNTLFCSLFNFINTAGSTSYKPFTKSSKPCLRALSHSLSLNTGNTFSSSYLFTKATACCLRNGRLLPLRKSLSFSTKSLNNFRSATSLNNFL